MNITSHSIATPSSARVLVLGAGYAGVPFVQSLSGRLPNPETIVVIDRSPVHQLVCQLHEAAAFSTPPERLGIPWDRLFRGPRFVQASVERIEPSHRRVITDRGAVEYQHLVIALGSEVNDYDIAGMREHAFTLRWLVDAARLRAHLGGLRERQDNAPEQERAAFGTIVIGGAGATGVQLAGELADWLRDDANAPRYGRIELIEALGAVLPQFGGELARQAQRELERQRVRVRLRQRIVSVSHDHARLDHGQEIVTKTVVWAGGVRLPDAVASAGLPQRFGGIAVDATLCVEGVPEITVIGDCANLVDRNGKPYPASAQLATQAAPVAAANVAATLVGRPRRPFAPNYLGEAVSVGRETAVTRVGPLVLTGFAAATVKRFTEERYVTQIGGVSLLRDWAGR